MILNKIIESSIKSEKSLRLGVPCCDEEALILLMLNTANIDCFSSSEKIKYQDLIKSAAYDCTTLYKKVNITENNKELWERNNPECISKKEWERIALKICHNYQIEISLEKINTACDIAFEITKNIIDCDVLTLISIQQKLCDLNIKVEKNVNQCKIDYKLLLEKNPNCNLTVKEYIKLIDSGYSFEILSNLYHKNVRLEVSSTGQVTLISPINKYNLPKDLKFKEIVLDKNGNISFPQRILEDYNITNKIKKQLLNEIHFI